MGAGTRMETRENRPTQNKLRFFSFFLVDRGGLWLISLVADERRHNPTRKSDIMKQENQTMNQQAFAAITAKYIGASNCRGSRIKVTSQRGSKTYPYPHELSGSAVFAYAAGLYLESIKKDDLKQYGENAEGWGELSDFSHGVLPSGEHVFVRG